MCGEVGREIFAAIPATSCKFNIFVIDKFKIIVKLWCFCLSLWRFEHINKQLVSSTYINKKTKEIALTCFTVH